MNDHSIHKGLQQLRLLKITVLVLERQSCSVVGLDVVIKKTGQEGNFA